MGIQSVENGGVEKEGGMQTLNPKKTLKDLRFAKKKERKEENESTQHKNPLKLPKNRTGKEEIQKRGPYRGANSRGHRKKGAGKWHQRRQGKGSTG